MPDRAQHEVLLRTFSRSKAQRVADAIRDARNSRPRPGTENAYPTSSYTCWRTLPRLWTASGGVLRWLTGPWEKHWSLPPWKVTIKRWPNYEDYSFIDRRQSDQRVVSREDWEAFVERMKQPWKTV